MWVIALASAAAGQGAVSPRLNPDAVRRQITDRAAKSVVDDLRRAATWDEVENGVSAGISTWIRLTPMLSGGTDAGKPEGLGQSLVFAWPKAPQAVLGALGDSGRSIRRSPQTVYSASFYEGDPTNIPRHRARAIKALSPVGDPARRRRAVRRRAGTR